MNTSVICHASAKSVSIDVEAIDSRRRYWAKLVRANVDLPSPTSVAGASNIPGPYLKPGEEEMYVGDVLFEGEANHHRKDRGWTYWVTYVDSDGNLILYQSGFSEQKAAAKKLGLSKELLAGSGNVAGAVRVAHGLRAGMKLPGFL